jgi:tetratricopeptide (TPR) repeat protein
MDEDEAIEVLISSAFPGHNVTNPGLVEGETTPPKPTDRDREAAASIAEELNCLPIAVVQAGCYIQQHKVLHQYLVQLRANRAYLLHHPTEVQRDKLKYPHSVYASFDIVLHALPPRALKLLGVLSFFHFSNFPRPLFAIAAESKFTYEYLELVDRPSEFHESIQFLNDILCPHNEWRELELYGLLEDLQKYSLVTMVPIDNMITLRFHPLVHNWARDRLSVEERAIYQAAAVRLFICGVTEEDDHGIQEYLEPHLASISAARSDFHVNDQAALSIFSRNKKFLGEPLEVWRQIHATVEAKYGPHDVRTSRALLQLAEASKEYKWQDRERKEAMMRSVIATREAILGRDHPETAAARASLARWFRTWYRFQEAEATQKEVLRVYIRARGLYHRDTAQGMTDLATTYGSMRRYVEEEERILSGVVVILTKVSGRAAQSTIRALNHLAQCYYNHNQYAKTDALRKQVLALNQEKHGEQHLTTVESTVWFAQQYQRRGLYREAEALRRIEVETRKRMQGDHHHDTLVAICSLAQLCESMKRNEEAEQLWKEELVGRQVTCKDTYVYRLHVSHSLAQLYEKLERYEEAEELRKEELARCQATKGDTNHYTLDAIHSLAQFYERLERYEEAEEQRKQELARCPPTKDGYDRQYLETIRSFAQFYERLERYEKAEELRKEELAHCRATSEDTDWCTQDAIYSLAEFYVKTGRYDDAEPLWKEELGVLRATEGDTMEMVESLAQLYEKRKRHEDLEQLWTEELASCRMYPNDWIHIVIRSLAQIYEKQERYEDAEKLWKERLTGCRASDDSDIWEDTEEALSSLAGLYKKLEWYENLEELWKENLAFCRGTKGDAYYYYATQDATHHLAQFYEEQERYEDLEKLWKEDLAGHRATEETERLVIPQPKLTAL